MTFGWYVFIPYVRLINCRFHLFRSSAVSFSSQYLLLFPKSSRSCVLLLPTPFTSVICSSTDHERGKFFSEHGQSNWIFLKVGYYLEVSSPLLFVQEIVRYLLSLTMLSSPFSSSTTYQSSPNTSARIFLVSKSLSHVKQW